LLQTHSLTLPIAVQILANKTYKYKQKTELSQCELNQSKT